MEAIQTALHEIGEAVVTTRIRRHLFGQVVALRIDQEDHLEEEEELVLPLIRARLSAAQQCEIVQRLLRDPQAEDQTWVVTWLMQDLTEIERHTVAALTAPLASTRSETVAPVPVG
jgi:hypothetical protein